MLSLTVSSVLSMEAVTITSSLRQGALCPGDFGATITCTTVGNELNWWVNSLAFSFYNESDIGMLDERNGYSVSLIRRSSTLNPDEFVFVSILNVFLSDEGIIQISCRNQRTSTRRFLEFLPMVSGNIMY